MGIQQLLEAVIKDAQELGCNRILVNGDIILPGPGRNELFELLSSIPITATVRGNWDDCVLEALDGEYGLENPQEVQLLRLTQYLMEELDTEYVDWIRSLLSGFEERKSMGFVFFDASLTGEELRR